MAPAASLTLSLTAVDVKLANCMLFFVHKNSTGAFVNDVRVIQEDIAAGASEIQVVETLLIPPNVHIS